MCVLWFRLFSEVHVQECCGCVCVCEHLWLQSGLVCGCMSLALCARKVSVWAKGGKAWSLRSDTLQWCLCVFTWVSL